MTDRTCETCSGVLVRRMQENSRQWAKRRFCSRRCVGRLHVAGSSSARALERLRGQQPTAREMQVVQCVARGMKNPEIAVELNLAPTTVKQHIARIGVKFGIGDRAGIVGAAIRSGLLRVPVAHQVPDGFDEGLFDVLVRIARGMSNAEIGAELHLSYESVKSRVRRLLKVLGVRNREEAVAAGVACGALRLVPVRQRERVAA